ncbi:MAG: sigma-54-dependent Fis family transcriptional regulator [Gammaproteobacteria bacterium]|nr:sigma-54-dependent Fis family transcriptional regulator [Gammaproteobacteria bacterium]
MMSDETTAHAEHILSVVQGTSTESSPEASIARSWVRCVNNYGLDAVHAHQTQVLEQIRLREHQQRLDDFLEIARIEMNNLYQRIAGSGFAVILTDGDGVIVNWICDANLSEPFKQVGLWPGAIWDEENEGTNGIGTALIERRALTVHRHEHFLSRHIRLTCSAAPIFDPQNQLLAVLDISSVSSQDSRQSQFHTLALAALSARMIEHGFFLRMFRQQWILRFHHQPEFIGGSNEGLLAFDDGGRVLAANQSAADQLRQPRHQLVSQRIDLLFAIALETLLGHASGQPRTLWPIIDKTGQRFFTLLYGSERQPSRSRLRLATEEIEPLPLPVKTLEGLAGRDPLMAYNVGCVRKVMNKRVNILLTGETGTGKEAFTKAIHEASARADKPFVAVNCASIPETLIESELFGYKYGAFTGARQEGRRGKILQAHGGTLFLDEIGDMPPSLQTRLLRVLEEKEVLPLGSDTPVPVDVFLVSATHRNLQEQMATGAFREDLYYRLNGLELRLPALRERSDRLLLIRSLLAAESDGVDVCIDEDALMALNAYAWPGNIRQLRNVLRTAAALCEDQCIRLENLPAEIIGLTPHHPTWRASRHGAALPSAIATDSLAHAEREALLSQLDRYGWNITNTAAHLGFSRNTLYRKMRKHGIQPREYPTP